jgi:Fe-S-cluster containining protein
MKSESRIFWISDMLKAGLPRLSLAEQDYAMAALEHWLQQFANVRDEHGPSVAVVLHEHIDAAVAKNEIRSRREGHPPSCRAGCSHCCNLRTDLSWHEAELLVEYAQKSDVPIDRELLKRQMAGEWGELPAEDRRCVFLSEAGTCRVYRHRPSVCRKMLVASDPDLCDTIKNSGAKVGRIVAMDAEIIDAAAATALGGTARMAEQLLGVLATGEQTN